MERKGKPHAAYYRTCTQKETWGDKQARSHKKRERDNQKLAEEKKDGPWMRRRSDFRRETLAASTALVFVVSVSSSDQDRKSEPGVPLIQDIRV